MLKIIVQKTIISVLVSLLCAAGYAQGTERVYSAAVRITAGDLLELSMYQNPDLSGKFRVDENGDITLPLAGKVRVAGRTAEEAAVSIEKKYVETEILQPSNAYAEVIIAEYTTQKITVIGEIRAPGNYPSFGGKTLNDVIAGAGGLLETASTKVLIAHRDDHEHPITVDYDPFAHSPVIPKIQIYPGDTVTVPKAGIVYVVGAVTRQSGILLSGHYSLTAMRAMSEAGPDKHGAKLECVLLLRNDSNGKREVSLLNMKKIFKGELADVPLKDGDILFVGHSWIREITPQAITTALGFASGVSTYTLVR